MGKTFSTGLLTNAISTNGSNNVGIGGAADATAKLKVTGAATFSSSVTATQFAAGSASATYPFNSISAAGTQAMLDSTRIGGGGIILRNNGADSIYLGTANWTGISGFGTGTTDIALTAAANSSAIVFATGTSVTERMRITSDGWFKASNTGSYYGSTFHEIRSNNTNNALQVSNTNATPYGMWIHYPNSSVATTNYEFIYTSNNAESKFIVWSNGSVINRTGSYGTISDVRYKENIIDATSKLDDLMKLKVRNFNMIGNETKQIGFIAQEFEEVFPKMVDTSIDKESGEEYKSIKTSVLVPILVKAIQEQQAQIEAHDAKIEELKALIAAK